MCAVLIKSLLALLLLRLDSYGLHIQTGHVLVFFDLHSNLAGNTLIAAESSTAVTTDRPLPVVNDDPR